VTSAKADDRVPTEHLRSMDIGTPCAKRHVRVRAAVANLRRFDRPMNVLPRAEFGWHLPILPSTGNAPILESRQDVLNSMMTIVRAFGSYKLPYKNRLIKSKPLLIKGITASRMGREPVLFHEVLFGPP